MARKPKPERKISANAKVAPDAVRKLDEMARAIRPTATRSVMISAAVEEYVKRNYDYVIREKRLP